MRQPLLLRTRDVFPGDTRAVESLVTVQILYVLEKIDEAEAKKLLGAIDKRIGRERGKPDYMLGGTRFLLENGISLEMISPYDPHKMIGPNGKEYVREVWLKERLSTPEEITELLLGPNEIYSNLHTRARISIEMAKQFRGQWNEKIQPSAEGEVRKLLAGGKHVIVLAVMQSAGSHTTLLVLPRNSGSCFVYDPSKGVINSESIASVLRRTAPGMTAYTRS